MSNQNRPEQAKNRPTVNPYLGPIPPVPVHATLDPEGGAGGAPLATFKGDTMLKQLAEAVLATIEPDRRPTHDPCWRDADPVKVAVWLCILLSLPVVLVVGWWLL